MYRAIEKVGQGFLFPNPQEEIKRETDDNTIKSYFNRDIEKNFEQKTAVSYFSYAIGCITFHYKLQGIPLISNI